MASAGTTTKGTASDLLTAVQKLPAVELREFTRGFAAWMNDQNGENGLDEETLLANIRKNSASPAREQRRFDRLRKKRQGERLSAGEQIQLQELWQRVEQMNAARLAALAELARKRRTDVRQLMVDLGIQENGKIF